MTALPACPISNRHPCSSACWRISSVHSRQLATPAEGSQLFYNASHGAMLVALDESKIDFQFISIAGEVIDLPASAVVKFRPVPELRESVKEKHA